MMKGAEQRGEQRERVSACLYDTLRGMQLGLLSEHSCGRERVTKVEGLRPMGGEIKMDRC